MFPSLRDTLPRDLMASVVVFLVALPLCMGIAIASGVPPAMGLLTGIVGGIIVGTIAGSPLQVSGPAAGLIVSVWAVVDGWGLESLGYAVLISGALQLSSMRRTRAKTRMPRPCAKATSDSPPILPRMIV